MATLGNAVFDDSDSENDPDFVPDEHPDSDEEAVRDKDKDSAAHEEGKDEETKTKEKGARAALWASFQSSVVQDPTGTEISPSTPAPPKLIKVVKRYKFAGDELTQVVEVSEDSEDAKRWPVWKPSEALGHGHDTSGISSNKDVQTHAAELTLDVSLTSPFTQPASTAACPSSSTSKSPNPIPPVGKRPGPRKPKTLLTAPMGKPKKITTLEKSTMDWKAHVQSETVAGVRLEDELEANRRAGGYLDRVDFLERVGARKEEIFDQERSAKRRKG